MSFGIYLDHNATTPVAAEVLEEMLPYFTEKYGNAASGMHAYGWIAADAVEKSRERIAKVIGCEKQELIFTSGATEAINLAIKGVWKKYQAKGKHILVCSTEHRAVLDTCLSLQEDGAEVEMIQVDKNGIIDIDSLSKQIRQDTILVAVMLANNETGVIQNISLISEKVHENNSILLCDTTQAIGKMDVDVNKLGIDLACISGHKIYGPKGVGVLFVRRKKPRVQLYPLIEGGGHENGLRSGTLNVPGIVGLGKACQLIDDLKINDNEKIKTLRDHLENELRKLKIVKINAGEVERLTNTSNICFKGKKAEDLFKKLGDVALSTGSACSSALPEASHVLLAMGLPESDAYSSVRFSLGRDTSKQEIDLIIDRIKQNIE